MPEYLAPGVFVEETSFRSKSIEGVATSTAGFVGPCHHGPLAPTLITSYSKFARTFGGDSDLDAGQAGATPNYLALAVRGFFENGGRRAYIARTPDAAPDLPGGATDAPAGLAALAAVDDISLVVAPAVAAIPDATARLAAHRALIRHAEEHRRFAILSVPLTTDLAEARSYRSQFDSSFAAMYFPWVLAADNSGQSVPTPPDGHVAGIFARTDSRRGVHRAPANENVQGIRGLCFAVSQSQQGLLNPEGINCLRVLPGRGRVVYGARTISSDPEWKYINVRRLFLFLERSIDRGTQWAVFEPNTEALWARIRSAIEDFLYHQWAAGALQGVRPDQAYFVRCDRTTMTQNDLDNGRLIVLVGVAPLRPAEFVIFRIGQWTADHQG